MMHVYNNRYWKVVWKVEWWGMVRGVSSKLRSEMAPLAMLLSGTGALIIF